MAMKRPSSDKNYHLKELCPQKDLNNVCAISSPESAGQPAILSPSFEHNSLDLESSVLTDLNSDSAESPPVSQPKQPLPVSLYIFGKHH